MRVPDGKSLLLVGGDINIDGGGIYVFGGRVELGGLSDTGKVGLDIDGSKFSLKFPDLVERSDVELSNGARVNVRAGNGGSIAVNARNLEMNEDGELRAGIEKGLGSEQSRAGNIDINVTGETKLNSGSAIRNNVRTQATGEGGDININTGKFSVLNGSLINSTTFGIGKGGNLTIEAKDIQIIDGYVFAQAASKSTGDSGDLNIKTNNLLVQDGGLVSTTTLSKGKAGNLIIEAKDIRIIRGDAGVTGLFALVNQKSTEDGGELNIKTNNLLVKDGAWISTATLGKVKGGNLTVEAKDIQIIGETKDGQSGSKLFTSAEGDSTGDGGELNIKTNNLLVQNGASVSASTFTEGNAGNLTIEAKDIQLIRGDAGLTGLFARTNPTSTGNGGDLNIKTNNLLVQDGAIVSVTTLGKGKGGNLTVEAKDIRLIRGDVGVTGFFARVGSKSAEDGGELNIKTNNLLVQGGAGVNATTSGKGKGGNLTVKAKHILLIGKTKDGRFPGGLFTSAREDSTGDGGDLNINTNTLQVENGARVNAQSIGTGRAGNLIINADSILLNNDSLLTANTRSNKVDLQGREQATININSKDIILRRSSNIFTNATGENVIGGNININSDVIAALENSDISANSANFLGGNVNIITQGIFGTQFREQVTPRSDITATGADSESSGSVTIDGLEQNPAETLTELPSVPVDGEVYQACQPNDGNQSEFYFTGNGGLPPNPRDFLTSESVDVGWVSLPLQVEKVSGVEVEKIKSQSQNRIVEATGFAKDKNGDVFLVAQAAIGGKFGIGDVSCLKE